MNISDQGLRLRRPDLSYTVHIRPIASFRWTSRTFSHKSHCCWLCRLKIVNKYTFKKFYPTYIFYFISDMILQCNIISKSSIQLLNDVYRLNPYTSVFLIIYMIGSEHSWPREVTCNYFITEICERELHTGVERPLTCIVLPYYIYWSNKPTVSLLISPCLSRADHLPCSHLRYTGR